MCLGIEFVQTHRFGQRIFLNLGTQFSRYAARTSPYFANRQDISGNAGGTIYGSVVNYANREMTLSGNSDLLFNRYRQPLTVDRRPS